MYWYIHALKHYADFKGTIHRRGFWMFMLISLVITLAIALIEVATDNPGWLDAFYSLLTLVPLLAIVTRRVRDTGLSLWCLLLLLIPGLGMLAVVVILCLPTQTVMPSTPILENL